MHLGFSVMQKRLEGSEGGGELRRGIPGQRQFSDLFAQDNQ